jgi:tetratricopeptide (TPR) repeat protein
MDTGQPVPEPVSVGLYCGAGEVEAIHTDIKGYFQFTFGAGPQSNRDMAASDSSMPSGMGGMNSPGGFGGAGGFGGIGGSGRSLLGCELRVSVSGYQPVIKSITDPGDIGQIDAGTLELRRIAGVQGSSISVTSLQVPNNARKEFEKGDKDLHSNHVASGTQHLEKAVAEYDKYAAAWTELGEIYANGHEMEKAKQAYGKAISSDPQYIPPYLGLATLEVQTEDYEGALDSAGKVLALDPRIGVANYVEALADFKLGRVDEAEKNAKDAEKGPHQSFPQVHVLLANLYIQKQDYSNAAAQMRAYLKESPRGSFAANVKTDLEQIEKSAANVDGASGSSAQAQIAP